MNRIKFQAFVLFVLVSSSPTLFAQSSSSESKWFYKSDQGGYIYGTTPKGDKIPDFSYAGYKGGGVAIPDAPVKITVSPSGKEADQSDAIQKAIDQVAAMPEKDGIRGAVLLLPGNYYCSKTIVLHTSGVIIRGSGDNEGGTTIHMIGENHNAFIIGQENDQMEKSKRGKKTETYITDSYVPAGSNTFSVKNAKGFAAGDRIAIHKPVTASWLHQMQMDILKREGEKQVWIAEGSEIIHYRHIEKIDGNQITVGAPLTDNFDSQYLNPPGVKVSKTSSRSEVTNAGIENLHIQCPPLAVNFRAAPYLGISLQGDNCWVRDVYLEETMNAIRFIGNHNTALRVKMTHTYPNLGPAKPSDFNFHGSFNLIDRCEASGGNTYFVTTGAQSMGPNVLMNSTFHGHGNRIQPHSRWSTGLLVDNCTIMDGGIDFMNRGVAGSGHGWTMGWAVAWNCVAKFYTIQNPPGSKNWAIGCIGDTLRTPALFNKAPIMPDGEFDSHQKPVKPQSLYLAQLSERLGEEALHAIGYASNSIAEFKNKNVQPVDPLIREVDSELGENLSAFRPVLADNERDDTRTYAAENAVDNNPDTFWATEDGIENSSIVIDTEGPLKINAVLLKEKQPQGNHTVAYKLEGMVDSDWVLLSQGKKIGERKIARFPELTIWKVRLTILEAEKYAAISHFGLYLEDR